MQDINKLTKKELESIDTIVLDVDGVIVPRGTKISIKGDTLTLNIKQIPNSIVELIRKLSEKGYNININSGRGLYMLLEMFREILPYVSITYENGSATWINGHIKQHVCSFPYLKDCMFELMKVKSTLIKGFEPKENIITIHCKGEVKEIDCIVSLYRNLYTRWNGEAYDICVSDLQTKANGVIALKELHNSKGVIGIGDNYNDIELLESADIKVTADKSKLEGDYYIPLNGDKLPGEVLLQKILELC